MVTPSLTPRNGQSLRLRRKSFPFPVITCPILMEVLNIPLQIPLIARKVFQFLMGDLVYSRDSSHVSSPIPQNQGTLRSCIMAAGEHIYQKLTDSTSLLHLMVRMWTWHVMVNADSTWVRKLPVTWTI